MADFCSFEHACRLEHVALAGTAPLIFCLGDIERVFLLLDIVAGDCDQVLGGADAGIGRRDIAEKCDQNLIVVRNEAR